VPVAYEVARELDAPLDVFLVRKLGVPGQEELAFGAIASGGVRVLNGHVTQLLELDASQIEAVALKERRELERRECAYRGTRSAISPEGKTVILVDDGLATGSSMRAAVTSLRKMHPARIVAAAPVGAPGTCAELEQDVDEIVCAKTPDPFYAVGWWYEDFSQTTDTEVHMLLDRAASGNEKSAHHIPQ